MSGTPSERYGVISRGLALKVVEDSKNHLQITKPSKSKHVNLFNNFPYHST